MRPTRSVRKLERTPSSCGPVACASVGKRLSRVRTSSYRTVSCGKAEIAERTIDNSAAYLNGWLERLRSDKTLIVQASAQAQKAADFILGKRNEDAQVSAPETTVSPAPMEVAA